MRLDFTGRGRGLILVVAGHQQNRYLPALAGGERLPPVACFPAQRRPLTQHLRANAARRRLNALIRQHARGSRRGGGGRKGHINVGLSGQADPTFTKQLQGEGRIASAAADALQPLAANRREGNPPVAAALHATEGDTMVSALALSQVSRIGL